MAGWIRIMMPDVQVRYATFDIKSKIQTERIDPPNDKTRRP
jgi:hypothetical protein